MSRVAESLRQILVAASGRKPGNPVTVKFDGEVYAVVRLSDYEAVRRAHEEAVRRSGSGLFEGLFVGKKP